MCPLAHCRLLSQLAANAGRATEANTAGNRGKGVGPCDWVSPTRTLPLLWQEEWMAPLADHHGARTAPSSLGAVLCMALHRGAVNYSRQEAEGAELLQGYVLR